MNALYYFCNFSISLKLFQNKKLTKIRRADGWIDGGVINRHIKMLLVDSSYWVFTAQFFQLFCIFETFENKMLGTSN